MRWFTSKKSKKAQQNQQDYPHLEETDASIDVSRQNSVINLSSIQVQTNQVRSVQSIPVYVHHRAPIVVQESVEKKSSFLDALVLFGAGMALGDDLCDW